jgi:hypothetical protein
MRVYGSGYARTVIATVGTIYYGSLSELGDWSNYSTQYTSNPQAGGVWTWAQINALQAGVRLSTVGKLIPRCTQVYIEIDYTPSILMVGEF